ncbi:RIP metalloprotease [Candidatus Kaiserbacteria bacterium]|nr:RIP metalloprotease [Candidatus Kaiserbacteria bacterium]
MPILVFILVIVALILVHELGHFIAAKLSGMRVDEFGLGYPPRALTIAKKGGTEYTLNWLPFGGFVKIYGEDGLVKGVEAKDPSAFTSKNRFAQAVVLLAGVSMNLLFAYALIVGALIAGTPRALAPEEITEARNVELAIARVLPGSPAAQAGLKLGDSILTAEDGHNAFSSADPEAFTRFVASGEGNATIALTVRHADGEEETVFARPVKGLATEEPSRAALGVEIVPIGIVSVPVGQAITEGATLTYSATWLTAVGLGQFFYSLFTFTADLSQVSGPVGIAGAVGTASSQGAGNVLSLMALISINLALINLIPVPALDGGRFLFVLIESVIRRSITPKVAYSVNAVGFALLVLLMVVVTANDIFKLVG